MTAGVLPLAACRAALALAPSLLHITCKALKCTEHPRCWQAGLRRPECAVLLRCSRQSCAVHAGSAQAAAARKAGGTPYLPLRESNVSPSLQQPHAPLLQYAHRIHTCGRCETSAGCQARCLHKGTGVHQQQVAHAGMAAAVQGQHRARQGMKRRTPCSTWPRFGAQCAATMMACCNNCSSHNDGWLPYLCERGRTVWGFTSFTAPLAAPALP